MWDGGASFAKTSGSWLSIGQVSLPDNRLQAGLLSGRYRASAVSFASRSGIKVHASVHEAAVYSPRCVSSSMLQWLGAASMVDKDARGMQDLQSMAQQHIALQDALASAAAFTSVDISFDPNRHIGYAIRQMLAVSSVRSVSQPGVWPAGRLMPAIGNMLHTELSVQAAVANRTSVYGDTIHATGFTSWLQQQYTPVLPAYSDTTS